MELAIYQVDAFTSRLFGGNPAAVVPLEGDWLPDAVMQNIAAENNLAETSFILPNGDQRWKLRWFTPGLEVDLCGHATLAAAHVILQHLDQAATKLTFETRSGELIVTRDAETGMLALDFPARPPEPCAVDSRLKAALGGKPLQVLASQRDYMVVYESEDEIAALEPDQRELRQVDRFAVIVTAPGKEVDFVSRFFAPKAGIDEDPVTGSAHCTLIPYWADRLGKQKLSARQISKRVGELSCELQGERVRIAGHSVEYLRGTITV
ncbi:putative isomerase [Bryobacterales bacterium F-183]|nr:putative isomerase [Bryobacterales bacterium F-183]